MARTRLYRSIVVFGTALGLGGALLPACDLYFEPGGHPPRPPDGREVTCDGWHGIIDAALPPDAWPTIADAPNPDAPPHAAVKP